MSFFFSSHFFPSTNLHCQRCLLVELQTVLYTNLEFLVDGHHLSLPLQLPRFPPCFSFRFSPFLLSLPFFPFQLNCFDEWIDYCFRIWKRHWMFNFDACQFNFRLTDHNLLFGDTTVLGATTAVAFWAFTAGIGGICGICGSCGSCGAGGWMGGTPKAGGGPGTGTGFGDGTTCRTLPTCMIWCFCGGSGGGGGGGACRDGTTSMMLPTWRKHNN